MAGGGLCFWSRFVRRLLGFILGGKAFASGARLRAAPVQPPQAEHQHHGCGDQAQSRRGKRRGAEIGHGNRVLDGRRAGQRRHGEGKGSQRNRGRHEAARDVGTPEKRLGDGVHRKGHDKQGNTAVGENGAGQHHGEYGAPLAQCCRNALGNDVSCPRGFHQLAEDRAQQEQRKVGDDKAAKADHEDLGVAGQHQLRCTEGHGQQGCQWCQQQHTDAAIGQSDEQTE